MIKRLSLVLILILFFISCGKKEIKRIEQEKFFFGTYVKIVVYHTDEKLAKNAIDEAFKEIERVDSKYNSKVEGSLVSRLNSSESKELEFDDEGIMLLNNLNRVYTLSAGKYDVTISPLLNLWGFTEDGAPVAIPEEEQIQEILKKVDFSKVKIEGKMVKIEKPVEMIDTGSFLKGYALRRAKEVLKDRNIESGFLTFISSIDTIGTKPDGKPWKIGLQNPNDPSEMIGIVELNGQSMGVSGDYQTYVEIDGVRYHHILDKETGFPVRDKKMVVVINKDPFDADMYSTAFFSMETEDVLNYVNSKEDLEVLIVKANNEIVTSKNFKYEKVK